MQVNNFYIVERIQEYMNIPQEEDHLPELVPPKEWPTDGHIEVRDLSLRYSDELPDVLHNVTFQVSGGEKLAIVGRTGAGKSSLSTAFFRLLPFTNGSITIDGIDICKISLFDLRSKLTIIPQDPVLFNGTIRSNLDPTYSCDDAIIWTVLNRVQLLEVLHESAGASDDGIVNDMQNLNQFSLDSNVSENGSNFSQGQRQLLCLARSLLHSSKIIILDEATANVDNVTDACIQKAIRSEFSNQTIITIAHRLRTIIDYDKILVLENGRVVEFGSPSQLLQESDTGIFKSMCLETGEYQELAAMCGP